VTRQSLVGFEVHEHERGGAHHAASRRMWTRQRHIDRMARKLRSLGGEASMNCSLYSIKGNEFNEAEKTTR
jgi:hypothetical protein